MKPLYPAAASRYVKKVIEMRECDKDEKSAIIHCAKLTLVYVGLLSYHVIQQYKIFYSFSIRPEFFIFMLRKVACKEYEEF